MLQKTDKFFSKAQKKDEKLTRNVYLDADYYESARCILVVEQMRKKIQIFLEEFPENNVLIEVLKNIDKFLKAPISIPLMRLASLLEKMIGFYNFYCLIILKRRGI